MLSCTIVAPVPLPLSFFLLTDSRTGLALSLVRGSYSYVMVRDDALSTDLERDPLDDDYFGYLWLPCSCSIVFIVSGVYPFSFFLIQRSD